MRSLHAICAAALATFLLLPTTAQTQRVEHDLALVLAIDCSFSVDHAEFLLQMKGLGEALQNPLVFEAISKGPNQKIMVAAMQWSDNQNQVMILPWSEIASEADAREIGAKLAATSRMLAEGGTAIGNALLYANESFIGAPPALRRVIDVSTDGRNNMGPALGPIRDNIVASGVTINALAITNEMPTLHIYAENQIVGGVGHFVIKANDYDVYGAAILKKLVKEVTGPGTT
jgi:hypothetical protein